MITDPEVWQDIGLRNATERDKSRGGDAKSLGQIFGASDAIVEHWPCRGGCGTMIGVDRHDVENLAMANRRLAARREKPIGKHEVMWCPACKRRDDLERAQNRGTDIDRARARRGAR